MIRPIFLFSMSALVACSGDKGDSGQDTSAPEDTQAEDHSIDFAMSYVDGNTGAGLEGAEVCVVEPDVGDAACNTTDEDGLIEWTWLDPIETNFLNRLTLEGYVTTLYLGRYDDAIGEGWAAAFEETGVVEGSFVAFSESIVDQALILAGTSRVEGTGQALFALISDDESSMVGATAVLTNSDGESVGEVLYVNSLGTAFDSTLESTSAAGGVSVVNVAPGTHTLTLTSSDFTCSAGFSWPSGVANTTTVPVEADTMTMGSLFCSAL